MIERPHLLAAFCLVACSRVVTRPAATDEIRIYVVGALSFEVPSDWRATGDVRRVRIVAPGEEAAIEASAAPEAGTESECLANAEAALARGAGGLQAVRRHATSFAGRRAVAQEADQGAWHGWAWAACTDGVQYRIWFAGRSPLSRDLLEVQRRLLASAQLGGAP